MLGSSIDGRRRVRLLWYGLLAVVGLIVFLAMLPPVLSTTPRAVVMEAFSTVCHQLPGRSLHLGDTPVAICDRCGGIYLGLVLGVATVEWGQIVWRRLDANSRYLLLGSLAPLGIDWIGPLLGFWSNGPTSRAVTGLLFGLIAASYVTDRLLRRASERGLPTKAG